VINYYPVQHQNGRFRIVEELNGVKRCATQGKRRYFTLKQATDFVLSLAQQRQHKEQLQARNERLRVNV
jgi:hypothetical protein